MFQFVVVALLVCMVIGRSIGRRQGRPLIGTLAGLAGPAGLGLLWAFGQERPGFDGGEEQAFRF